MGDEILKNIIKHSKQLFILLALCSSFSFAASSLNLGNDTKEYDKIFEKISETRIGINPREIDKIKNPFIVIYKNVDSNKTKKPKIIYNLDAIFDNKAMINKKWYKKYSKIGVYKLVKIKNHSVLLRSANKSKELFIRKDNESKIKFSTK